MNSFHPRKSFPSSTRDSRYQHNISNSLFTLLLSLSLSLSFSLSFVNILSHVYYIKLAKKKKEKEITGRVNVVLLSIRSKNKSKERKKERKEEK